MDLTAPNADDFALPPQSQPSTKVGRAHIKRPWNMALCVHGFQTRGGTEGALSFEWSMQHPNKAKCFREGGEDGDGKSAAGAKPIPRSMNGQLKVLHALLLTEKWRAMDPPLEIHFTTLEYMTAFRAVVGAAAVGVVFKVMTIKEMPFYQALEDEKERTKAEKKRGRKAGSEEEGDDDAVIDLIGEGEGDDDEGVMDLTSFGDLGDGGFDDDDVDDDSSSSSERRGEGGGDDLDGNLDDYVFDNNGDDDEMEDEKPSPLSSDEVIDLCSPRKSPRFDSNEDGVVDLTESPIGVALAKATREVLIIE
jgi:hypothetical protein